MYANPRSPDRDYKPQPTPAERRAWAAGYRQGRTRGSRPGDAAMTATTADPGTHLDTIEHLDWTPGCQTPAGRCVSGYTQPAVWAVIIKCGCTLPACDPCAQEMRREKARGYTFKTIARCKTCSAEFPGPINIEDLYIDIRPL